MKLKNLVKHLCLLPGADANQADDAAMIDAVDNGKLAEVLVESDEDAALAFRRVQDLLVSRILPPIPRPFYIKAAGAEFLHGFAPNAAIQQDLQADSRTRNSSMRS